MNSRDLFNCACATLVILAVAACDPSADSITVSQDSGLQLVLRRGNGGEPQTLDPVAAEDVHSFAVLTDLYEGLVIEAADGSLLPGVAERWDLSPDGRQYTFYLRQDAFWSNGEPVKAQHFVAGFRRVLAPGTTSAYAFLLEPMRNYQAVLSGKLRPEELGIHAVDDRTLTIELKSPAQHFLGILAMPIAYPLYPGDSVDSRRFHDPMSFIGNGPFVLESWLIGEKIRLAKNPRYRNAKSVQIDTVEYLPITDPHTELNMFRVGELDITFTVPKERIAELRESQAEALRVAPTLGLYYLAFDLSEPPLDDVRLRQALTMAIDRQALVTLLGRGEQAAFGIVPPGVANHVTARYSWQDMAASDRQATAHELIGQAGYDADHPLQLRLTYDTGDVHETVALAVASMWQDVLGIDVELEKKEWKYFLATRDDRPAWQIMRFSWIGDYNDPGTFTEIFRSDSEQNLPRYRNPDYDRLLDDANRIGTPDDRAQIMSAAESLLLDDYPVAPLYFYVSKHLVSSRVEHFEANVLDRHPTQFLRLKQVEPQ
jgi:oligopeptide transport system substrate-binding protein